MKRVGDKGPSYVIRKNGIYYEAVDSSGEIMFGGSGNAGNIDGIDPATVIQAALDALPAAGGEICLKDACTNLTSGLTVSKPLILECSAGGSYTSPNLTFNTSSNCITVENGVQIILRNLYIDGQSTGGHIIDFSRGYFSVFENVSIKRAGRRGINIEPVDTSPYIVADKLVVIACKEEGFFANGSLANSFNIDVLFAIGNGNGITPKVANVDLNRTFYSHFGSLVASGGSSPYGGASDYGLIVRGALSLSIGQLHLETLNSYGLQVGTSVSTATEVNDLFIDSIYAYDVATVSGNPIMIRSLTSGAIGTIWSSYGVSVPYSHSVEVYNVKDVTINAPGELGKPILDYYGRLNILSRGYSNSGTATITIGSTSVSFPHNLNGIPTIVTLGAKHSEVSGAIWAANATQITITVPSAVSGDRQISWIAQYRP